MNSCPMFTYSDRDMHRMPAAARTHLPIKPEIVNSGIMEEDTGRDSDGDPSLFRLPAPSLHGTFAKAYALLTKLVSKIGWDELLKCRSSVFVMEEEYRMQKAAEEQWKGDKGRRESAKSSVGKKSIVEENSKSTVEEKPQPNAANSIPTITISSDESGAQDEEVRAEEAKDEESKGEESKGEESNGEESKGKEAALEDGELEDVKLDDTSDKDDNEKDKAEVSKPVFDESTLEKPKQAADEENKTEDTTSTKQNYSFSFNNKRLCERWLDNLFMVLYEVFTWFECIGLMP